MNNRQEYHEKYGEEFIKAGFKQTGEEDILMLYKYPLVSDEQAEENDIASDEIPALLFGSTGMNNGFCIFTGSMFIWLNVETPQEAVDFANKISVFEPVF